MAPVSRPALPLTLLNPHLAEIPVENATVKYQTIVREGHEIVVGRVKVPTNDNGHAFILRRYDTGAFSLTTMFKACFPGSSDEDERRESDWVKATFDNSGANGGKHSEAVRLAGSWVTPEIALSISKDYGIEDLINALATARPDPSVAYRKSQRSQAASDASPARLAPTSKTLAVPSETASPASKRTRTSPSVSPRVTRRSPLGKSTAASPSTAKKDPSATLAADQAKLETLSHTISDADRQIQEAKDLVKNLKSKVAAEQIKEETGVVDISDAEKRGTKRNSQHIKEEVADLDRQKSEGGPEVVGAAVERAIASNSRARSNVVRVAQTTAWGAVLFAVGVGATTYLPRFFGL